MSCLARPCTKGLGERTLGAGRVSRACSITTEFLTSSHSHPKARPHASLGYRQGAGCAGAGTAPKHCPGRFPPLSPLRKEFTPKFRPEEVFHHCPDSHIEMLEGLGVTSAEKTLAFRFERKLVSSWTWLPQAVLCGAQETSLLRSNKTFCGDGNVLYLRSAPLATCNC